MENEEELSGPSYITSFGVVQNLDGSVTVLTDTGLEQVREASLPDLVMLSRYVADLTQHQLLNPAEPKSQKDALREKFQKMPKSDG